MSLLPQSVKPARDQAVAFEELAVPLFRSLYNFASWLTHDRSEAEDLVQETYARALKGFGSFTISEGERGRAAANIAPARNARLVMPSGIINRLSTSVPGSKCCGSKPDCYGPATIAVVWRGALCRVA